MSNFNIEIKGLDAIVNKFKKLPKDIEDKVQERMNEFAINTASDAKQLCPVDEGFLRNSIAPKLERLSVSVVVAADYAAFVEFGTRAFAAQYVGSLPANWQAFARQFKGKTGGSFQELVLRITQWVKRKGIVKGKDVNSVAYLIALKILRKGTPAKPFLVPSAERNRIELENNLLTDFRK